MSYSYITFLQLKQALAARLGDPGMTFWTNSASYSELGLLLQEALRTWSALTQQWRTRASFNVTQTPWYDLSTAIPAARGYAVNDQQTIALMEYALAEPLGLTAWNGTALYSLNDFTQALQRRRDQFIAATGCTRSVVTVSSGAPGDGRVSLPDSVIEVLRAAWVSGSSYTALWREDELRLLAFLYGYQNPVVTPSAYSFAATPLVTMQVAPPFSGAANIELVATQAGAALNPATGVLLGVPDEFAWAVRFGALADLLGEAGEANDAQRAAYCEQRWDEGVQVAKAFGPVINAEINGVPLFPVPLQDFDLYQLGWESTPGPPAALALVGWNLIALAPFPDAGSYSVTLDVVTTPVPVADTDEVQLGREDLDAVLSYAQHLAAFKLGGAEFQASGSAYQAFAAAVKARNGRMQAMIPSLGEIVGRNLRQTEQVPEEEQA